jgi:acetyl esterase/lipase
MLLFVLGAPWVFHLGAFDAVLPFMAVGAVLGWFGLNRISLGVGVALTIVLLVVAYTPIIRGPAYRFVRNDPIPKDADAVLADACPVVASYGGRDRSLRNAAAKLDALLTRNGIAHDVKEYQTAGHSFLNEEDEGAVALRPVMRMILGAGPDPEAAADAWKRIETFFATYLR